MGPAKIMIRIEHVAWQVEDPTAVAAWYGSHLGFTILRKIGPPAHTHFLADGSGNAVIEIYNNPKASMPDYRAMDPLHLHLAFAVDDPSRERDRLLRAGATIVEDMVTTPSGDVLIMLRDPWGFAVQLVKRKSPMLSL